MHGKRCENEIKKVNCKHPLTEKELTEFVEKVILILKEESLNGYLTEREYRNYVRLFHFAVDRVLAKHSRLREEVSRMTEPLIKLPSVIEDELHAEIAEHKSKIAGQEAQIAEQKSQLASKDAEIRRLQELVSQLSSDTTH